MQMSLERFGISGVLIAMCTGPFKLVFMFLLIWGWRFLLLRVLLIG